MRILLLKMLLPLICFNLAGGFSYAASVFSGPVDITTAGSTDQTTVQKKEVDFFQAVSQILKEADESPVLKDLLGPESPVEALFSYRFSADKGFCLQYYLSYYDRYIKVRQPQVYLLDCVFII